jgi:WD40 repeat protein
MELNLDPTPLKLQESNPDDTVKTPRQDMWLFTGANTLKQWSLRHKGLIKDFGTHKLDGWVNTMDYNLAKRFILINKQSAIIRYDLVTDQEIQYLNILSSDNGTKHLQITHDGKRVFLVDQGFLKELEFSEDFQTLTLVKHYGNHQLWCMKMSNDGKFIWTGGYDHCLRKWSVDGQELVKTVIEGHSSLIRLIRFTEDGKYLLTFQQNAVMRRVCLETDEVMIGDGPQGPAIEGKYKCAALSYCGK